MYFWFFYKETFIAFGVKSLPRFIFYQLLMWKNRPWPVKTSWFWRQPMATQNGSTYISKEMIDIVEIPTANVGFWPQQGRRKCSQAIASGNSRRKQKTYTAKTTALKFQWQVWYLWPFRAWNSVRMWLQRWPTDSQNVCMSVCLCVCMYVCLHSEAKYLRS